MFKKSKMQLRDVRMHDQMPLDKMETLNKDNCLDAHAVEERNRVAAINIKESCDNATDIGANFDNALYPNDHSKTFDRGL
jgi:hypothetical protein